MKLSIFEKFKRKKTDQVYNDTPVPDGNFTEPETLAKTVKNDKIEPGMPLNFDTFVPNSNMRRVALAGVSLIAAGVLVSGLIGMTGGEDEAQTAETQAASEPKVTQKKDFERDKNEMAMMEAQAASEVQLEGVASEPVVAASQPVVSQQPVAQYDYGNTQPAVTVSPEKTAKDRKLGGDVLVNVDSDLSKVSSSVGHSDGQGIPVSNSTFSDGNQGGASNGNFASRLNPTATDSVQAQQIGDSSYLLSKGTNIRCGLDTKIVTTQPGFTRCIVSKDVYSANGQTLLIERGSKVIGEQTSALLQGQARVFVLWNEVETPSGVKVSLRSPGAGSLGEGGHGAYVNYHFWRRFGGAMMISLIGDATDNLSNHKTSGNNNNITYENSVDSAQQLATEALKNSINIPPTGTINQGSLINIMVARDVDFSNVYELVNPYGY
ncbi:MULTISPECIES: type IV secretion system protein VirB10 [unclassified Neisseria]|uniref:type IV secretion system protein VirB10 n=1 Tax=unclassified Neisseria TaxID=2623750 RepID=UPI002666B4F5|nr:MULTISPECIES: type IV secretion system protein VirB10 [unclassified Neisseria]MDO1509540.1 type IV secretion system protein VirB10 [Neisseria sp. MVDL19-042950]MDO1515688.1 type IV secretion system protein VirB10 [Neisseria sp. MVDL18-041461]MDO1563488.1 type IV secretion system protein VirB10 [Neisseria sp. MVDL20-010259]